jgi:hypothetical protein
MEKYFQSKILVKYRSTEVGYLNGKNNNIKFTATTNENGKLPCNVFLSTFLSFQHPG